MLSSYGQCRPFDKRAQGYVRSEGGVVLVLQRDTKAHRSHARVIATGSNSDGRTNGVSLPSAEYQARLLEQVYGGAQVSLDDVAFIEAHGTGTRVGDPAEALALGRVLGIGRSSPLPIGSVKSNIGHLEPASGIAGLLKAMLALEHDELPSSLHFDTPNPDIDFAGLNLEVNTKPRPLPRGRRARFAGVSNFGFGGTNAHVIISDPLPSKTVSKRRASKGRKKSKRAGSDVYLMLSAQSSRALQSLAAQYDEHLKSCGNKELAAVANATAYQHQKMSQRLVVYGKKTQDIRDSLAAFGKNNEDRLTNLVSGVALSGDLKTALVYSGNGSQWAGMGRAAFAFNKRFTKVFTRVDKRFSKIANWSLIEVLHADNLAEQLKSTRIA